VADDGAGRLWHQALAYAVCGRRLEQLGRQRSPDIAALSTALRDLAEDGALILPSSSDQAVHSVPKDLMQGLGAAQFHAALSAMRGELGLVLALPAAVAPSRPPTPAERRLNEDAPPHHRG
jgi:hypothetical protein